MQEIKRINEKNYTDADATAFYMRHRETSNSPFIREIGDFIAHRERDRGLTLERSLYQHAQIAFMLMHGKNNDAGIEPFGECPWWFKSWLLGRFNDVPDKLIMQFTGMNSSDARGKVNTWFKRGDRYPTKILCHDQEFYFNLMVLFSRSLSVQSVFTRKSVEEELEVVFKKDGIDTSEIENFIVATCVLLSGKTCELANGYKFKIFLQCNPSPNTITQDFILAQSWPYGYFRNRQGSYNLNNPHGHIRVMVTTTSPELGNMHPVFELFDSRILTNKYISDDLIEQSTVTSPSVWFRDNMSFDRSAKVMVY